MAANVLSVGDIVTRRSLTVAQLASLADETPEGRSYRHSWPSSVLNIRERQLKGTTPLSLYRDHRWSGLDIGISKDFERSAGDSVKRWVAEQGGTAPQRPRRPSSRACAAPDLTAAGRGRRCGNWWASLNSRMWSSRASERSSTRCVGWVFRTVMITGDNP